MTGQQLLMEHEGTTPGSPRATLSTIRTILLHILDDEFHDQRIACALSLARACSAHLSCLHVTPIEAYVAFDKFGGIFVMNDIMRAVDERDAELRRKVEDRLAREDVSWDYEQRSGSVVPTLLNRAALADIVITAREQPHPSYAAPTIGFLGDLLHATRTPLLIPALTRSPFNPAGPAVIAWDGSIEAADAVRLALGLLAISTDVRVIQIVDQGSEDRKSFPATDVVEYLSRHGIHAQLKIKEAEGGSASNAIIARMIVAEALSAGASYLVMGGYSHARIAEYVFGGVTRALLKKCPVALVVAR